MCMSWLCGPLGMVMWNSLLLVFSASAFISLGVILVVFYHLSNFTFVSYWFFLLPVCLISCGVLNFLSGVFSGLVSAKQKSHEPGRCCMLLVGLILVVNIGLQATTAFGCLELRSTILQEPFLTVNSASMLSEYFSSPELQLSWDNLQRKFMCCGGLLFNKGYMDWKATQIGQKLNAVPDSCCHEEHDGCGSGIFEHGITDSPKIYVHGCLTVIQSRLSQDLDLGLLIGAGLAALTAICSLFAMTASCCSSRGSPPPAASAAPRATKTFEVTGVPLPGIAVPATGHKENIYAPREDMFTTKMSSQV